MTIILFGCNGMLGSDLSMQFKDQDLHGFSKNDIDITSKKKVLEIIKKIRPDFVINAAAYTDVDGSEINRKKAMLVNATAVKYLALACCEYNSTLVHFSTDYVFDGENKNGYKENAKGNPINFYGLSKLKGEDYIKKICGNKGYYIIRTQWLYGHNGKNFVDAIIKLSKNKHKLKVVNDQFGSPTYTKDIAKKVKILMGNYDFGIYHITNNGVCTWYDLAELILKLTNNKTGLIPIASKELNKLAKRPKCSILLNTKFKSKMRNWESALKDYITTR